MTQASELYAMIFGLMRQVMPIQEWHAKKYMAHIFLIIIGKKDKDVLVFNYFI